MKSKKLLVTIVAIALVACTAIAGTYAAFKAQGGAVKNTFTFANGITVQLKETNPTGHIGEAVATGTEDAGYSYTNVVPGQDLMKQPYITTSATFESYVFVKVTGLSADVHLTKATDITDNGWTAIGTIDAYGNGIYYKDVAANDTAAKTVFSSVTIANNDGVVISDDKVVVAVTATQKAVYTDVNAALADAPTFATVA